ncbi:hypothetical protein GCM10009619_42530 [Williamsia maris]
MRLSYLDVQLVVPARRVVNWSGRRLFWVGIFILALSVVMIGTVGEFQHPSKTFGCDPVACTPGESSWPTGSGLWIVIGVAALGVVLTVAGALKRRREARPK